MVSTWPLLTTHETGFVNFNGAHVANGIIPIGAPILNEFQVVSHAAAVDSDPMNTLNPFAMKSVSLQCFTA